MAEESLTGSEVVLKALVDQGVEGVESPCDVF